MSRLLLLCILLIGCVSFGYALDWGLPNKDIDQTLFGGAEPWSGERIATATRADARWDTDRAANIDVDEAAAPAPPAPPAPDVPWEEITATEEQRAEILTRYRLYSHHPDEMTVFQAIRAMDPATNDYDPQMYQYGGLFIYPVAALLKAASLVRLIDLQPGVAHYLDNPQDFARFYVVARAYSAFFGLLGIIAAYLLGTALRDRTAGLIAALLFALMPITINMAHEAKPHLPAAVLMMWAAFAAIRYAQRPGGGRLFATSLLCGLAAGMVPTGLFAWILLPVAALSGRPRTGRYVWRLVGGIIVAALVYFAGNPYVAIHLVQDPGVLTSNWANTSGMYGLGHPIAGGLNMVGLVAEGTGTLLAACGVLAGLALFHRRTAMRGWLLWSPALLVLVVMTAFGAGKPGEFGRFAIYLDVALMMCAAAEAARIYRRSRWAGWLAVLVLAVTTGLHGNRYHEAFRADATPTNTRAEAARWLADELRDQPEATIGVLRDPAPYCVPPLDFAGRTVEKFQGDGEFFDTPGPDWVVRAVDRPGAPGTILGGYVLEWVFGGQEDLRAPHYATISWADKPVCIYRRLDTDAPVGELLPQPAPEPQELAPPPDEPAAGSAAQTEI